MLVQILGGGAVAARLCESTCAMKVVRDWANSVPLQWSQAWQRLQ